MQRVISVGVLRFGPGDPERLQFGSYVRDESNIKIEVEIVVCAVGIVIHVICINGQGLELVIQELAEGILQNFVYCGRILGGRVLNKQVLAKAIRYGCKSVASGLIML